MPTTSNFGWTTPADTDLVKDGAAAIRTLGNGIDTSLVDLKGGTTGQVLAKASNADLDYTWSNVDPLTILDAKGDLISATAADTPARLASSGVNGDVLTVDTSTSTGLKWAAVSAGGMTEIASGSLGSSGVNITSIPGTYRNLVLWIRGYQVSSAPGAIGIRVNNSSSGIYHNDDITTGSRGRTLTGFNNNNLFNNIKSADGFERNWAMVEFYNYANTDHFKTALMFGWTDDNQNSGFTRYVSAEGQVATNNAITEVNVYLIAGTSINAGNYVLYGVK